MQELSNHDLLIESLLLAGGDDYDGAFTGEGEITFNLLKQELYKRLINYKFLKKDEYLDVP